MTTPAPDHPFDANVDPRIDPALAAATGLDPQALARQARRLLAAGRPPWLSTLLAPRMAERLDWIKHDVQHALLWEGLHGGGFEALRARYPLARIDAVEHFGATHAARLAPWPTSRLHTWGDTLRRALGQHLPPHGAVLPPNGVPAGAADLVFANQWLHAAPHPRALFAQWHRALAIDGFVLFSAFGPDTFIELRRLYAREGFGALAPQWVDLHDLGDLLVETGFAEPVMDQERLTLTWPTPERLWDDLAALGGNLAATRFAGLRTPAWKARWMQAVETLRQPDGRLALTVEWVGGHAIKAPPRLKVDAETRIGVDALRAQLRQRGG